MKKSLIALSIIASLTSGATCFAKTEGSYLGLDIIKSEIDVKTTKDTSLNNSDTYFNTKSKDSSFGAGLSYGYAFNFNNFFITPGVFYDFLGNKSKVRDGNNSYNQDVTISSRYGVKANLGYDITDKFSAYVPVGFAINNYEFKTNDYFGSSYSNTKKSGTQSSLLYGVGLSFLATNKVAINLEYNRSSFDVKSYNDVALLGSAGLKSKVNNDALKLGVSYRF